MIKLNFLRKITFLLIFLGGGIDIHAASKPNRECEELAASPLDDRRSEGISGVKAADIAIEPALEACSAAVKTQPANPADLYNLGRVYHKLGNIERAHKLWEAAATQKYPVAMYQVSRKYYPTPGNDKHIAKGMRLLEEAARLGHPRSMSELAMYLKYGKPANTKEDCKEAHKWLKRAMVLNDSSGYWRMGLEHQYGTCGYSRNFDEARKHYETAIKLGDEYGKSLLAQLDEYISAERENDRRKEQADAKWRAYWQDYERYTTCLSQKAAIYCYEPTRPR